ncbi:MAG: hypothetical protein IJO91_11495, partial [Oscillospiraceae bacterium]|nr:hypothetical protein [Oscillospiraceae bacterium]
MLRRLASLTATLAAAAVISMSAYATNGGVVGNVVDAGENIVNDVVDAGENVVDDVTDAVTGGDNNTTSGNTNGTTSGNTNGTTNGTTGGNTNNGTTNGTTGGTTNGTTGGTGSGTVTPPDVGTAGDAGDEETTRPPELANPDTGISFPFAAIAAISLGGAGVAFA